MLYQKLLKNKEKAITLEGMNPEINFRENLRELWEEKLKRFESRNPVLREFYTARILPVIESKTPWKQMTIEQFETGINGEIAAMQSKLDIENGLAKPPYKLENPHKRLLAKKLIQKIRAKELIELSMTEIMDQMGGNFNKKLYDLLLQKAGVEYLAHIPAL